MKGVKAIFLGWVTITLTIIGLAMPPSSHAGGLTFGAKVGSMVLDIPNTDDPINAGVVIGYEFDVPIGGLGFEGEFTTTTKDGQIADEVLKIDTGAAYATYRSPGLVYLKGRLGYAIWDASQTLVDVSQDESFSMGLGLGINLTILKFELEYTQLDEDIDYVSLAIQF